MNHLILGTKDKTPYILDYLEAPYLLIDDGSVIDAIPPRKSYTYFDPYKSYLDPLAGMNDRRARDFVALINAIFPEGENTLTRKNSNHYLLKQLLKKPKTLQSLITDSKEPAETDASQKIENLLLSPILKRVFKPKASTPHGVVLARLDRKKLGDFVAFVLAHALIGQFKGTIVICNSACNFDPLSWGIGVQK